MKIVKVGLVLLMGVVLAGCKSNTTEKTDLSKGEKGTGDEINETSDERTFIDKKVDFWEGDFAYEILEDNEVLLTNVESDDNENGQSKNIKSAQIPEKVSFEGSEYTVVGIGEGAFDLCENLVEISMPDSIRVIESNVFNDCMKLSVDTLPTNIETIGNRAFSGVDIEELVLGEKLMVIGEGAFGYTDVLKKVVIPENVEELVRGTFVSCKGLQEVTIKAKSLSIEKQAFFDCEAIKTFYVPAESLDYYKDALSEYGAEVKAME